MSLATTAAIGGVSGVLAWAVEIPLDGLKSRWQELLLLLLVHLQVPGLPGQEEPFCDSE